MSSQISEKYFLITLCERNGDYEYEHVGLLKTDKAIKEESERIASRWYDAPSEPDCSGFSFHQGCVSVSVSRVKRIGQRDAKVLLRYLSTWR